MSHTNGWASQRLSESWRTYSRFFALPAKVVNLHEAQTFLYQGRHLTAHVCYPFRAGVVNLFAETGVILHPCALMPGPEANAVRSGADAPSR